MWNGHHAMVWPMWFLMIAALIGLWILVALLVRQAFSEKRPDPFPPRSSALAELDARLARGEITAEDYISMRRLISDGH